LISLQINAQQYTKFNGYGFQADRLKSDSVSIHPSDTIRNKAARSIAVIGSTLYIANGTKWNAISGGSVDTFSLSTRAWRQKGIDSLNTNINARVKYTDTSTMLSPYLRKADTTTLSNRINLKLNIADTATMLSNYSRLKSVGLTMPSAFSVANSPLTSNGTLAVTGAGTSSQYVRGDGQLANFPDNGAGGSSVNYYLNGSVNQGTFGGDTYYEMSKTPVLGAGTNFTRTNGQGNGYIASFITDAGDPSLLNIPAGNWNLEFYFASSASGGSPEFYGEIYKVSSSNVFTLVASGSANPEGITNGTTVDQYFTSISVPQTSLLITDRLAIRIYVVTGGRTITLHTENGNLCEIITTFSTGLNAFNGLTSQVQYFATGTSGTDFAISSATDTHTFNLPTASATNRGALSSANWTTFNSKIGTGDTATMLTPYLRKADTTTLSNRINTKQAQLNGTGFVKATGTTISYDNSTYLTSAITSLGGQTGATQTFTTGTGGSDFNISSGTDIHSFNLPVASTSNTGKLTSGDYTAFQQYKAGDISRAYQLLGSTTKAMLLGNTLHNMTANVTMTSQQIRFMPIYIPFTMTLTGVTWYQVTAGNYTANNYNGVGLYYYTAGSTTLTLAASSTDDGNIWKATSSTWNSKAFSSTYAVTEGMYYIAVMYSSSAQTTAPAIGGIAAPLGGSGNVYPVNFTSGVKLFGTMSTQTSLPSPTQNMSNAAFTSTATTTPFIMVY
jgi:hypothetical protein